MLRLPPVDYVAPRSLREAIAALSRDGARAVSGGTDLIPKLKRRQVPATTLVSLGRLPELASIDTNATRVCIGSGVTLAAVARDPRLRLHGALREAADSVASPPIRARGTLGGNLLVDPRCTWYDQTEHWRACIGNCLKVGADVCRVAPHGDRCFAVSSTDTAPALLALGAEVEVIGPAGSRRLSVAELLQDDGIAYHSLRPGELIVAVELSAEPGWRSCYWKVRRRFSIDFPLLSVAAAVRFDGERVTDARIALGGLASAPISVPTSPLLGTKLDDDAIAAFGAAAGKAARPVDTSDLPPQWRKKMAPVFVGHALRELRGDDVSQARRRYGAFALGSSA